MFAQGQFVVGIDTRQRDHDVCRGFTSGDVLLAVDCTWSFRGDQGTLTSVANASTKEMKVV